jgi:hypothetical protein
MKLHLKVVALVGAVALLAGTALATTQTMNANKSAKQADLQKLPAEAKASPANVPAGTPAGSPSQSGATPSPVNPATATPKPTLAPKPSGPCQGMHASDDGCVAKDTAAFQIASVILSPQFVACGSDTTVTFGTLMATRHYTAGAGGTAVIQIDYSDGTSSPVISLPFRARTDVQSYSGLTHTFAGNGAGASYRIRLTSPNVISTSWAPATNMVTGSCAVPSPSPYTPPFIR